MIAYLHGILAAKTLTTCIIDVGGVGYELGMSTASLTVLGAVGDEVSAFTYLNVKDDGIALYGFATEEEKEMFGRLITVSGVGPKVALSALSTFKVADLAFCIQTEDVKRVSTIPGVGKKTAQRIVLELKGSIERDMMPLAGLGGESAASQTPSFDAAAEALYSMGFTAAEVELAFKGYEGEHTDTSALVRYGLKRLGAV